MHFFTPDLAEKNHIEKGDTIQLQETLRNSVEILPTKKDTKQVQDTTIDASNKTTDEILQLLISTYLNGFTQITINNCDDTTIAFVKEHVKHFVAADVMRATNRSVVISIFWDEKTIDLDAMMRRVGQIIKDLFSMLDELVATNKHFSDIISQGVELQRQILLAQRSVLYAMWNSPFAKSIHRSSLQLAHTNFTLYFYGMTGDYLVKLARLIHQAHNDKNLHLLADDDTNQQVRELLDQARRFYSKVFQSLHTKDKREEFIFTEFAQFTDEIDAFRKEHREEEWVALFVEFMKVLNFKIKEAEATIISYEYTPSD